MNSTTWILLIVFIVVDVWIISYFVKRCYANKIASWSLREISLGEGKFRSCRRSSRPEARQTSLSADWRLRCPILIRAC